MNKELKLCSLLVSSFKFNCQGKSLNLTDPILNKKFI